MPDVGDLKGAKVTIRNEYTEEIISETTVLDYDRQRRVITVDGRGFQEEEATRVVLLIISRTQMLECAGIARRVSGSGKREIPIYRVQVKESRVSTRFEVRAPAKILSLSMSGRMIPMDEPLEVTVINISTSGILLSTKDTTLQVGSRFQLWMERLGKDTAVNSTVVRELGAQKGERRLGCSFLSVEPVTR